MRAVVRSGINNLLLVFRSTFHQRFRCCLEVVSTEQSLDSPVECSIFNYLFFTAAAMMIIAISPEAMDPIQIPRLRLRTEALAETMPDRSVSRSILSPSALLLQWTLINHNRNKIKTKLFCLFSYFGFIFTNIFCVY